MVIKKVETKVAGRENFLARIVLPISTISVFLGFVQAWIFTFYFGDPFNQKIGWIAHDGDWPPQFAFGVHFFSDYLAMNQISSSPDPWSDGNIYPPVATAVFRIFAFLPYKIGLCLWLIAAIASVCIPLFHASRGLSFATRIQLILLVGLLSAPVIGTLDRGNNVFLLVPLLYFGLTALIEDKKLLASILLGLACAIKLYPILILFFLILKRKWTISALSTAIMLASTFITSLIWGNPFSIIKHSLTSAAAWDGIDGNGQPMLFSFVGFLNNFLVFAGLKGSKLSNSIVQSPRLFGVVFLLILIFISLGLNHIQTYLLALTTMQLIPTVSFTYTRIWTVVVIALLVKYQSDMYRIGDKKSNQIFYLWWGATLGTNTLVTYWGFWPISIFPTLAFLAVLVIIIKSFRIRLIHSGFKGILSDVQHIIKVNSKSTKTE